MPAGQVVLPTVTDDDGTYQVGTIFDAAFFQSIEDAINGVVYSATNPTITPADIIDEVVLARGSKSGLDVRLDVEHNADGTHNLPATVATVTTLKAALANVNLVADSAFLIWGGGDSAAPSHWTLSGTGATIARTGSGLSDTSRKVGPWGAKVTYGSATAQLFQYIVTSGQWASWDNIETLDIGFGCWVKSSTVSKVRIFVDDGNTQSYSSYHTGGGSWEWLSLSSVHTVSAAATYLAIGIQIEGTGNFVASGPTVFIASQNPDRWMPSPCVYGSIVWKIKGAASVGDGQDYFVPARPMIIKDIQMYAKTGPSGGPLTIDIEKGDGTTFASIFASTKSIDDTKTFANAQPDSATYSTKCITGLSLDNGVNGDATNAMLRLNVDAVNSAADVWVYVRGLVNCRALEQALAYNEFV